MSGKPARSWQDDLAPAGFESEPDGVITLWMGPYHQSYRALILSAQPAETDVINKAGCADCLRGLKASGVYARRCIMFPSGRLRPYRP